MTRSAKQLNNYSSMKPRSRNKVIGFDTAKRKTGWAFSPFPRVWETGIVDVADSKMLAAVLSRAKAAGVTKAAIENCYLDTTTDDKQRARANVRTLKALQEAQTRIRVACEMAGLKVVLVYAQTWQSAYSITGKRPDRKLGAQRVAHALGASQLTDDEADAVCLADYAAAAARGE
jgi:hypothetical protein